MLVFFGEAFVRIGASSSVIATMIVTALVPAAQAQQVHDRLSLLDPAPIAANPSAFAKDGTLPTAWARSDAAPATTSAGPPHWETKSFPWSYAGSATPVEQFNQKNWSYSPETLAPLGLPDRIDLGNQFIRIDTNRSVTAVPGPGGQSSGMTATAPLVRQNQSQSRNRFFGLSLVTPAR